MSILDWIFGSREDNEAAYAERLNEAASREPTIEDVPAWSRPMFASSEDRWTGAVDELGRKEYRTISGQTYFLDWDPDQRTGRMRLEDDVIPAVQSYAENPTLPSASDVGQFALDAAKDGYDTLARTVRGQGTLGDVLGLSTGVGGAGLAVSRGAADNAAGMFLNSRAKGVDLEALKRAEELSAQGVDRDAIWKDTGWGQFNGEWLTEIPDNTSEISDLAPYKDRGTTLVTEEIPGTLSQQDRVSARVGAQRQAIEIRKRLERGEIDAMEAERMAREVEAQLAMDLQAPSSRTVTREVPNPAPTLSRKGLLNEVLFHDSLYDAIPDGVSMPTAEAGRRIAESAGASANTRGVYYPQVTSDAVLEQRDLSRISSFKRDKFPMTADKADAVWSTALHETQHFMDDVTTSTSGRGSNMQDAKELVSKANMAVYRAEQAIKSTPELENVRQSLENITGTKIRPFTAYDWLDQVYAAASKPDADEAAKFLRTFVENTIPNSATDKVDQVVSYITAPNSDISDIFGKISQLKDSKAYRISLMDEFKAYQHEGGEVKARLTQERRNLDAEARRERPFWYDLPAVGADERNIYSQQSPNLDVPLGSIERPDVYYHGTDAAPFDVFDPAYNRTAKHIYLTPNSQDASAYGKNVLEFEARGLVADMRPGGRYRDAVVEDGRSAFQAAFEDHGLDDYFDSLEDFIDAFDAGDMYQRFGSQRVQNDVVDALLDVLNVDALRIPDAGFGGRMSESIVYQNPAYLRRVTEPSSASDSDSFAAQVSDDLLSTTDR